MTDAVMYARYNRDSNKKIYDILSGMSNDEREKDRGGYFGSLSATLRHVIGGAQYFLGLFEPALAGNPAALKALAGRAKPISEDPLDEAQWKELGEALEKTDAAYIGMAEALSADDLSLKVKVDWYGGNPDSAPLYYMLGQLVAHGIHHRGQISQMLDELKIEHEFSGISFLP
ncbi:MAG: DinB family protein [Treponema sp.]|nr:DinB family protein [Treponema sp.]